MASGLGSDMKLVGHGVTSQGFPIAYVYQDAEVGYYTFRYDTIEYFPLGFEQVEHYLGCIACTYRAIDLKEDVNV